MRSHISFSEMKIWDECPYKHKLVYKDKIKQFLGNEYTAFGTAIHHVCELKKNLVNDMRTQGKNLLKYILPALKDNFSSFEVISVEEDLLLPMDDTDIKFKGFIDLVIKTDDGKYHVIDWKTCSWGWDSKKKADRITM